MKRNLLTGFELIYDEEMEGVLVKNGDKMVDFIPASNRKEAREAIKKFESETESF